MICCICMLTTCPARSLTNWQADCTSNGSSMTDLAARRALQARLPRTWNAFFARHGNFTAPQLAAIPALLDGHNVMLCAATASGKTEATLAPLIEQHCPIGSGHGALHILYLTP